VATRTGRPARPLNDRLVSLAELRLGNVLASSTLHAPFSRQLVALRDVFGEVSILHERATFLVPAALQILFEALCVRDRPLSRHIPRRLKLLELLSLTLSQIERHFVIRRPGRSGPRAPFCGKGVFRKLFDPPPLAGRFPVAALIASLAIMLRF